MVLTARRIYIGNLHYDLAESDILLTFSPFGSIHKIDMPKDETTGHHKGFCFIEFTDPNVAEQVIGSMNGFTLIGRQIKVGRPKSYSNIQAPQVAAVGAPVAAVAPPATQRVPGAVQGAKPRVFISNVHPDITLDDMNKLFGAFGTIRECKLQMDSGTGRHQGVGYVDFEAIHVAQMALKNMHGFELGGKKLEVTWTAPAGIALETATPVMPDHTISLEENLHMGTSQRVEIMQKLARGSDMGAARAESTTAAPAAPTVVAPVIPGIATAPPPDAIAAAKQAVAAATAAKQAAKDQAAAVNATMFQNPGVIPALVLSSRCLLLRNLVGPEEVDDQLE
eukprot:gene1751-2412_t